MDVDSDEENANEKVEDSNPKPKESMPPPLPPLPPQLDNVLIRKDYNPKSTKTQPQNPITNRPIESYVISPITGEKIPADKLQEHMRFGLLDPRWVEQRDRSINEKMQQEEVYAVGSAIESSLKQLAERRTDIFGSGDEETVIGKKIGEEERKKPEKVTWDGHTASVEAATRAARANITIEEQIQQIHKIKGLLPEDDKDRIGPALPSTTTSGATISAPPVASSATISAPPKSQPMSAHTVSIVTTTINAAPHVVQPSPPQMQMPTMSQMQHTGHPQMMPPMMMSGQPNAGHYMMAPHMMAHMGHMYGMPMPPPHELANMGPGMPPIGIPPPNISMDDEPALKKQRTEENLIPEDEFIKKNPGNVSIKIQVPQSTEKNDWKLSGQFINLTLPLTDTISVIKAKIHEQTLMPPGKQKLQYDGIFVKDSNSLAFYNITNGGVIVLGLKERGGRKK
jgi:splicing factor 3A subunit 1